MRDGFIISTNSTQDALDLFDKSKRDDFAPPDDGDTETGYVPNPEGGFYDRIREQDAVGGISKDRERVRCIITSFSYFGTFYRVKDPLFLAHAGGFTCAGANGCDCG